MDKMLPLVMLPTQEKAGTIWKTPKGQLINTHVSGEYKDKYEPQHLYLLSDEKIKVGEYAIDGEEVFGPYEEGDIFIDYKGKIIATTDRSLYPPCDGLCAKDECVCLIPQLPESFLHHFIEQYNLGDIIREVCVEFEVRTDFKDMEDALDGPAYKLKINSDNTISIKPVKTSGSREEIKKLKDKIVSLPKEEQIKILDTVETFDKWIQDNL